MRDERGAVFLFAIVALFVLLVLGVSSLQLASQSLERANKEMRWAVAYNLAEAGADCAETWLRSQNPPAFYVEVDPLGGEQAAGNGFYRATVIPDTGNLGAQGKQFTIIGTGYNRNRKATSRVVLKVREQSFALYSYFTDYERSSISNDSIWFYARDRVYGPVHTNDQFHIDWDSTSADPIFYGTASSHSSTVAWSPRAPRNANEWRRVMQGGQDAMTLGVDEIALPSSSDAQKNAAWGATYGFPTSNGVYVPTSGSFVNAGIYIRGDSQITFSVDVSAGDQLVTIVQGSTTKIVRVDLDHNQTKITVGSTTTTYSGLPNGVIYSTGNITSLRGELANNYENGATILQRNAWTIATDVNAGKDINITNNLTYRTDPDPTKPATHPSNLRAATLGLIAEDIVIDYDCPNVMSIDAVLLAGGENTTNGSFYYEGWDERKRNELRVLGGIIQKRRGPVGTFNPNNNVHLTGYNKDYDYDPRLATAPPPFFPNTGQFDVQSWQAR
jgi:hypothetical protein